MNFTESRSIYLVAVVIAACLISCKSAERGEVTLTGKTPVNTSPEIKQDKPVALLSQTTKCLDIPPVEYFLNVSPAETLAGDCVADRTSQGWTITSKEQILSTNGLCLSVADQTETYASAIIEECDESAKQKWTVNTLDKSIRNQGFPNLCLDVNNEAVSGTFDGKLLACNGNASQQWYPTVLERKRIESASDPDFFINMEPLEQGGSDHLKVSRVDIKWFSGYWTIEPAGGTFRIRSYWLQDRFLNIESGELRADNIQHYWESAKWSVIKQVDGGKEYYLIRNFWRQDIYLGITGEMNLVAGRLDQLNPGSQRWVISNYKPIQ